MPLLLSGCVADGGDPGGGLRGTPPPSRTPGIAGTPTVTTEAPQVGGPRPKGAVSRGWRVYDVVDGDTIAVARRGRELTLRLIGIDTPETVHPFEPVGCFGPEASAFAQRMLAGERVMLELDRTQGRLDVYDRTLAYVWLVPREGHRWMFNQRAVRRGFALEYTYDEPYLWQREFLRAERRARAEQAGLWSPKTCDGPG